MFYHFQNYWEYWGLRDKVTFDWFNRLIIVNEGVETIDVKTDVYSAWKRWMTIYDYNKIGQVIRVIGGDETTAGKQAGDLYFLVNGWRLQIELDQTAIEGALFSDDFDTPLISSEGKKVFQSFVSNLVTGIAGDSLFDYDLMATKVWALEKSLASLTDSMGEVVNSLPAAVATIDSNVSNVQTDITALQTDIDFIKDIEGGKWEIVGSEMVFYKDDNVTEVARFALDDPEAPTVRTRA